MSVDAGIVAAELRPSIRAIELTPPRSIHIVGIGGAGMRAIAGILLAMGHRVSGSDRVPSDYLDQLAAIGAVVHVGHDGANLAGAEMVTRSTAVPDSNPEVVAAMDRSIPVFSRAEMLAAITSVRPGILVAGTHGKTTTSSMLAVLLDHAGFEPSFVIGADVRHFATGARWGSSEHFIVEADESDGTFLTLPGAHAIVTSLDPDHLEFYGSPARLAAAFEVFVDNIDGVTAVCMDDPDTHPLLGRPGVVTYGVAETADLQIDNISVTSDATAFGVTWRGETLGSVSVGLPGHHNALNAAGALAMALSIGVPFASAADGLARFSGVARRFEVRGEQGGVRFVDDYAHLPAEVEAAIATANAGPWNRVIATYQPHRFSRTQALGATFATSFLDVDHLVLTDIYPAGETPRDGITGRIVYEAVTTACPGLSVSWQPTLVDVADHLEAVLGPGDLCLTLGAGDLTTVPDVVIAGLRDSPGASVDWLVKLAPQLANSTLRFNAPVGPLTTYRVGGAARAIAEVGTRADLLSVVAGAIEHGTPILPVGKGSNLLVADRGFRGIVVVLTGEFDAIEVDGTAVTLGAAVSLPVAARRLAAQSLRGFEWAVGVPGSVGGAIAMNAGGHGSDMAATVTAVTGVDLVSGQPFTFGHDELAFGYRRSAISSNHLVLSATMTLNDGDTAEAEALLSEIVRWRRDHQPGGQNAGSVFTNPEGDSAGRLIDVAGGKGLRVGTAAVSEKHANFIQADPGGKADDIYALMHEVVALVEADCGVRLEAETRLVGFETASGSADG